MPLNISYEDLINGYRELFAKIYTWQAVGDRWLSNVRHRGKHRVVPKNPAGREGEHNHVDDPNREWLQKPLGRPKPHLLAATFKIAKYYLLGGSAKRKFAWRMMWNTLKLAPGALLQTLSYMAYFIHLREYADKVVAKEYKFDYA